MIKRTLIKAHPIQESNHILLIHKLEKVDIDEWVSKHYPKSVENKSTDANWSWLQIFITYKWFDMMGQEVKGYVYRINGEILGISIVAYNYPCYLSSQNINPYLWYIVKSQHSLEILKKANINPQYIKFQKYVYDMIYDEVKKTSNTMKTFWLHADPIGKDGLLKMYEKNGFISCPLVQNKIIKIRKDDNRYLYFDTNKFNQLSIPTIGDKYV